MSGNGNGENGGIGSSTAAATSSDVHPIELTVQSLIDSPLQILNLNLQSLYESQVILSSTLKEVQKLLGNSNNGLNNLSSLIHIENDEYNENDNDEDNESDIRNSGNNKRNNRDNISNGSGGNGNISAEDASSSDAVTIGNSSSVGGVRGDDEDGDIGTDINGSGSEDGFCTLQNVDTRTYQERVSYLREEMILITDILKKVENRVDKIVSQLE